MINPAKVCPGRRGARCVTENVLEAKRNAESGIIVHLTSVHAAQDIRIFYKECQSLARAGFWVSLIVPGARNGAVGKVHIQGIPRLSSRISRMTRTAWRIYQEAKRLDADIYHFHDPELIPVGLLLRARGKKVIYDIHEDVPRDVLDKHYLPNWSRSILSWIIEKFENSASRRFSALVGVTPLITDRFKPLNPRTVMVQNFPIPEELATVAPIPWNDRGMAVTYVGGIAVLRGIREMVQAMGLLPESLESTLELAGTAIYGDSLEVVSKQSGWSRTRYLGYLNRVGIANLFSRVRAGLVLFHPAPNHVAAMPMKLFEYMAAGLPVIASNFPTWREIVGGARCGLLVDPLKPREIANAIEHILTNPQEAEEMGRRGQEAVRKTYNWASQEKILLDLYCKLLKPPCAA